jgi:SAM-dependent methyltransferase
MALVGFLQAQNCTNLPSSWRHPESRDDSMSADYYQEIGRILEAGCGLGRWVVWLRRRGYPVIGFDLSHDALTTLHTHAPDVPAARADLFAIPVADATFDAVISMGVVEHAQDGPLRALRELRRVARPGAVMLLSVPFNNPFRRLVFNHVLRAAAAVFRHRGRALEFAEYRFDRREIARFLTMSRFEPLAFHVDECRAPKHIGLGIDLAPLFGAPGHPWNLNRAGQLVRAACDAVSPWLTAGCVLCVARAV